jgi:alpha-tubulin suppressor-like RCC1 family protein
MMRIGLFPILVLPLVTLMGCAGLPEKLPESAFDVPVTDTPPPSDTVIDVPSDVTPTPDTVPDVTPTPDTVPDVLPTPGTFAAECGVIGNFVTVEAGGNHTCGATDKGTVWCWGDGNHGQLGNNVAKDANSPVQVVWGGASQPDGALNNVISIALGESFGCALQGTKTVVCWGQGDSGQLGNGKEVSTNAPESLVVVTTSQPATVLADIHSIAAGDHHACGLNGSKKIRCWGSNSHKQLAHATKTESAIAINLTPGNVQSIAAGGLHTCLVGDKNRASCWGGNTSGQLGIDKDDETAVSKVNKVKYSDPMKSWEEASKGITAGGLHTCMWRVNVSDASQLGSCWGTNSKGELGYGGSFSSSLVAKKVSFVEAEGLGVVIPVTGILDMSAGKHHTCARIAINDDVKTICWGDNGSGQLGNGSSQSFDTSAVYVNTSHSFTQIAAGGAHTCGLTDTGYVYCWGDNEQGQLGTGVFAGKLLLPSAPVSCPTP